MFVLLAFYAALLGGMIGSFLNVVIHRYPLGESVVFPPSRCPHCHERIKPYDNIPVLSFLILGGKCRNCRAPISIRYPVIELANALFFLAIYVRLGPSIPAVLVAAIVSMTIALIYIDLEIQILPDVIDLPGIAVGLALAWVAAGWDVGGLTIALDWKDSLLGIAAGGGSLLAIALLYQLLRKQEGMGLGDVKMLAMIGAVTGWRPIFLIVLLASISGAIVGLTIAARRRSDLQFPLPFGVFLGFAFLVVLFFGNELAEWIPTLALGG